MEDVRRDTAWRLSHEPRLVTDRRRSSSSLAFGSTVVTYCSVHGRAADVGCDAVRHAGTSRLAAWKVNLNATINGPICVPNPNGIPSHSPGLRGTSYPGCNIRKVSNLNGVVSFGSRRCATTPSGLNHQSNRVPRVVASFQPWALLRSPFGANRGTPRSVSTPTPP